MAIEPQYITDADGSRRVVLPLSDYESLIEDLRDLAAVAERRDEELLSFDEVKAQLQADGLL